MPRVRRWSTTFNNFGVTAEPPFIWQLLPPEDSVPGVTVVRTIGSVVLLSANTSDALSQHLVRLGIYVGPTPTGTELGPDNLNATDWLWFGADTLFDVSVGGVVLQATDAASTWRRISSSGARRLEAGDSMWAIAAPHGNPSTDWQGALASFRVLYLMPS